MGTKGRPKLKEELDKRKNAKADKGKKKYEPKVSKKIMEGVRGIVRIAESDIDGTRKLHISLQKIKGVGQTLASSIIIASGLDPNAITGKLEDEQIKKIEAIIKNPSEFGIPDFFLNSRKDRETGENKHIVSSQLTFRRKSDIDRMKKFHTYKGMRHEMKLPVRGQRTRSSFRGGARIGVSRKAAKKGKKAAPAPARKIPKFYTPKILGEKKDKKK